MKDCKYKDLLYIKNNYNKFFKKEENDIEKMCFILSNYLEPNTVRIIHVIHNTRLRDKKGLKELFEKNNFVVRCDGFEDDSDALFDYLYDIIINSKPRYLEYELNKKGVFISLKKIGSDLIYDFIRRWSINYIYFDELAVSAGLYAELKTTITEDKYTCYRGMSFSKKNLIKFFDKTTNVKGKTKVHFDKFSSWTTDVATARLFACRPPKNEEKTKAYQVILKTIVMKNDVLASLDKYDPNYDQKELVLHPGTYEVILYVYDAINKQFINSTAFWDTYASIDI